MLGWFCFLDMVSKITGHQTVNAIFSASRKKDINATIQEAECDMYVIYNFTCSPTTLKTGTRLTCIKQKLPSPEESIRGRMQDMLKME